MKPKNNTVLIYAIRRTAKWWREVGSNMGYDRCIITADLKGFDECDYCVVDDFYDAYNKLIKLENQTIEFFNEDEVADIIARCRLLRWLDKNKAKAMINAMAYAFDKVLEKEEPSVIVSFPIDRYVSDVLERLGKVRGIPYYELTASLLPDMSMIMYRGELVKFQRVLAETFVEEKTNEIANPLFTPSYVQVSSKYNLIRFLKTFIYFKVRGWAFKIISIVKQDPLNLHYLDSQAFLGHKPSLKDYKIVKMVDYQWREKILNFDKSQRILFGLQLFPEASIDYWINDLELIKHEKMLLEAARAFSSAGFQILLKDHPLQYGFRQIDLLEQLLSLENVVLVPYEISGNELLTLVGVNFTCTGTLGLQAALLGLKSVAVKNYYTTDEDFITFSSREEIANLPQRVVAAKMPESLLERQRNIVSNVMKGSFVSDFFSFEGYDKNKPNKTIPELGKEFGRIIKNLKSPGMDML